MIKGKTKSGFEFEVPKKMLDNYELVENLSELESNPLLLTKIVVQILGKKQSEDLKDFLRDEDGIVPVTKMEKEVTEILSYREETKNY
ncbi:MAG: hypothetical protein GX053_12565 [Tissierella sp.]|nr:hypothetical protein [Tissierella sp.]